MAATILAEEVTTLGALQEGAQFDKMKMGHDGWCAYCVKTGKSVSVVVDGKMGKAYDEVKELKAVDHASVAYAARTGKTWRVVRDDVEGPEYADVKYLIFSRDGKRLAYAAQKGKQWVVVVDDKESKPFDDISGGGEIRFDPPGKRVVYGGVTGAQTVVVVDGEESEPCDELKGIAFSADGTRLAYAIRRGKECFAVVDGVPGPSFDNVFLVSAVFSPDSNRVGYYALRGKRFVAVIDGQVSDTYPVMWPLNPIFSPDSKHVAYIAQTGDKDLGVLYVDGAKVANPKQKFMAQYYWAQWGPDSKRIARWSFTQGAMWIKSKWSLILDDKVVLAYTGKEWPGQGLLGAFSPAATHFACDVPEGKDKRYMIVDDAAGKERFDEVFDYGFTDENTVVMVGRRGQQIVKDTVHVSNQ